MLKDPAASRKPSYRLEQYRLVLDRIVRAKMQVGWHVIDFLRLLEKKPHMLMRQTELQLPLLFG